MTESFTESQYKELITFARDKYNIIPFTNYKKYSGSLLLRHDIDFSVHRAVKLAKIESDLGITSTYFIHLHSKFYNILDSDITNKIFEISEMGHRFGLHFDPSFYAETKTTSFNQENAIKYERNILEDVFDIDLDAISVHMISLLQEQLSGDYIYGMVNVNSEFIKTQYRYCSDSFSRWRFKSFGEMLADPTIKSLHVLIHPEWWTKLERSPTYKIYRCLAGRSISCYKYINKIYNAWEKQNGN